MTGINTGGGHGLDLPSLHKLLDAPEEYRQRIADLHAAEAAARTAQAEFQSVHKIAVAARNDADKKIAQLNAATEAHNKAVAEFEARTATMQAGFANREAEVRRQENSLIGTKSQHDTAAAQKTAELNTREAMVTARENDVTAKQIALDLALQRVSAKLAKLHEAAAL